MEVKIKYVFYYGFDCCLFGRYFYIIFFEKLSIMDNCILISLYILLI